MQKGIEVVGGSRVTRKIESDMNKLLISTLIAAGVYLLASRELESEIGFSLALFSIAVILVFLCVKKFFCGVASNISSYAKYGRNKNIRIPLKIVLWTVKIALFIFLLPITLLAGGLNDRYDPWDSGDPYSPFYRH